VGFGVSGVRLRLPATSANIGAAFDSAAVALALHLILEAEAAGEFSIVATGRNADQCSKVGGNLILNTYRDVLTHAQRSIVPLAIRMNNQIPLGMGLGSSAAGRLAGVALACHFGALDWSNDRILAKACALEGHPDNAAACWLGGLVVASCSEGVVYSARVEPTPAWRAMVVLPKSPLATVKARAVLPESYSRADVVSNLQGAALLGLAFAQRRGDLLQRAMADRLHQPYRAAMCPLLARLLPLAGRDGVMGVALSGAGPSVLLIVDGEDAAVHAATAVDKALRGREEAEILVAAFETLGGELALGKLRSSG
jgi:homoserine kinase